MLLKIHVDSVDLPHSELEDFFSKLVWRKILSYFVLDPNLVIALEGWNMM